MSSKPMIPEIFWSGARHFPELVSFGAGKPVGTLGLSHPPSESNYPLPTSGIFVAITVRNSTLASSGKLAM